MTSPGEGLATLYCDYCGIEYKKPLAKVNLTKNYCSFDCRNRDMREIEICDYCGEPFVKTKSKVNKEKYYCSDECRINDAFPVLTCAYCGRKFVRANFRNRCPDTYCSMKCSGLAHRGKTHEITVTCDYCGKEIVRDECFVKRTKNHFCTPECNWKWRKENQVGLRGDKNPNWRGGTTMRPGIYAWTVAVLERDNYTCTECGSIEHPTAHHIVPWSESAELRYEIDNGATLCPKCHANKHPEHRALIMSIYDKVNGDLLLKENEAPYADDDDELSYVALVECEAAY